MALDALMQICNNRQLLMVLFKFYDHSGVSGGGAGGGSAGGSAGGASGAGARSGSKETLVGNAVHMISHLLAQGTLSETGVMQLEVGRCSRHVF